MNVFDHIGDILDRIATNTATEKDLQLLHHVLIINGDQNVVQIGLQNVIMQSPDETAVQQIVYQILESIRTDDYERTLQDYFRALREYCTHFPYVTLTDLLGSDPKSLNETYISLHMHTQWYNPKKKEQEKEKQEKEEPVIDYGDLFFDKVLSLAIQNKEQHPHIFIQGEPGMGKSSLLRYIGKQAWNTPSLLGLDRVYLPMIIRLQSLSLAEGASLETRLLNALHKAHELTLQQDPPTGFFKEWAHQMDTHWLLLLDGLDEVPSDRLNEVLSWLTTIINEDSMQRYHIVITSRPTTELPIKLMEKFMRCTLLPFTSEQQVEFAHLWLGDQSELFLHQISQIRTGSLSSTPLLLAIAIAIFKADGHIVGDRTSLYERFVDILLTEAARSIREELGEDIACVARRCLESLALVMTKDPSISSTSELSHKAADYLGYTLGFSQVRAAEGGKRFVEVMSRRSGLLTRQGNTYTWLHPTFREYLAAHALLITCSSNWRREVKRLWGHPQWQEVILFFLTLLHYNGEDTASFVRELLRNEWFVRKGFGYLLFLQICTETLCSGYPNILIRMYGSVALTIIIILAPIIMLACIIFWIFYLVKSVAYDYECQLRFLGRWLVSYRAGIDIETQKLLVKRLCRVAFKHKPPSPIVVTKRYVRQQCNLRTRNPQPDIAHQEVRQIVDEIDPALLREVLPSLLYDWNNDVRFEADILLGDYSEGLRK